MSERNKQTVLDFHAAAKLIGGGIVEHWDVMQPVPDASANSNGMF